MRLFLKWIMFVHETVSHMDYDKIYICLFMHPFLNRLNWIILKTVISRFVHSTKTFMYPGTPLVRLAWK